MDKRWYEKNYIYYLSSALPTTLLLVHCMAIVDVRVCMFNIAYIYIFRAALLTYAFVVVIIFILSVL